MDEQSILNEQYGAACELRRPFIQLRPRMFIDGNQWCALYGKNLQEGVAGFGDSPELAAWDFDRAWVAKISEKEIVEHHDCPIHGGGEGKDCPRC